MTTRRRPRHLGALILATAVIPPLGIQFEFSASAGAMAIAIMSMMVVLAKGWPLVRASAAVKKLALCVGLVLASLLVAGLISSRIHPAFDFSRFVQSLVLMSFCLFGACQFSALVSSCTEKQADKAFRFVFLVILFSSVARMLGIYVSGNHRSVFFYNEPSHYALGLAPFLLYVVLSDTKRRWAWMLAAVAVGLIIQSLTLLIIVLLIFVVLMRISFMTIAFTLLVASLALAIGDGLSYYTDRAALSSESTNLSNLVYLSGWERAQLSMEETFGLGYGFNQLGIVGDQGSIALLLVAMNAEGLNALDGGSVASKLIAEFGVIGVLLLAIYLRFFIQGVRYVRSAFHDVQTVNRIDLFFWSCVIMYSIDLFVRGGGYFTAEAFMLFGSMWGLARRRPHWQKRSGVNGRTPPGHDHKAMAPTYAQ